MSQSLNWPGMKFGRLTVLRASGRKILCRCECGVEKTVEKQDARSKKTLSCGCLQKDLLRISKATHGESRPGKQSPEYRCVQEMKRRCGDEMRLGFKHYGARGIAVCDRWLDGDGTMTGVECFIADMGRRPSAKHSIERVDNDKGYEPSNCVWATATVQNRNTRVNRIVDIYGEPMTLAEAIEKMAVVPNVTVRMRLHRGWDLTDALITPLRHSRPAQAEAPF